MILRLQKGCCYSTVFAFVFFLFADAAIAQTSNTAISYQGTLDIAGAPADGTYDFRAVLYDSLEFGNQASPVIEILDVEVVEGLVNLSLDFGVSVVTDEQRFLQLEVRLVGSGENFTRLDPRQELYPAPRAISADTLNGEVFQRGTIGDCSAPVSIGTVGNVTFPRPFASEPMLFLSPDLSRDQHGCISVVIGSKNTNGFAWASYDLNDRDECDCIHWLAIGSVQ